MAERAEERLELSACPVVRLRRSSHRLTAQGMNGHYTKIVLATGAEHAGVVDQNGDGRARSPGDEGLPELEGPGLVMAANLGENPDSDSTIVLRRLELLLLTSTSAKGFLAQ